MKRQLLQFVLLVLLGVVSHNVTTEVRYTNGHRTVTRHVRIVQKLKNVSIVRRYTTRSGYGAHHGISYTITRTETK